MHEHLGNLKLVIPECRMRQIFALGHRAECELFHYRTDESTNSGSFADGGHELGTRTVLRQIPGRTRLQGAHGVVLLFWHGQQQRFELVFGYALENLGAVIRFPHHVQVKSAGKNLLQALADNRVVVGYEVTVKYLCPSSLSLKD